MICELPTHRSRSQLLLDVAVMLCYDDTVALLVGHRTCDLQVAGSSPGYLHLCASATKQYNLVLAKKEGDLLDWKTIEPGGK